MKKNRRIIHDAGSTRLIGSRSMVLTFSVPPEAPVESPPGRISSDATSFAAVHELEISAGRNLTTHKMNKAATLKYR